MAGEDGEERSYFLNRRANKTIVSKRFLDSLSGQNLRIVSKVVDGQPGLKFAQVDGDCVLRITPAGRYAIKATILEDDRKIKTLTIQKYNAATGPASELHFSFVGEEIGTFIEFVAGIKTIPLVNAEKRHVTDHELREIVLSRNQISELFKGNEELFVELVQTKELKRDLVALGYRRQQLDRFASLLSDEVFFQSEIEQRGLTPEGLWQSFFEENTWIFGYGLTYQFLTALDNGKLERVVRGSDIRGPGKRIDALMKTRGRLNSICFIEIKRHDTLLLEKDSYRPGAWSPSKEVAGGVAQVQATVQDALENLGRKLTPSNAAGEPTGEMLFNVEPRSFLIAGHLSQFETQSGVNEQKFRSFELYRRNTRHPEILTFDELLERARFIVEQAE